MAIGLAWPALLADLDNDLTLLGRLESSAASRQQLANDDESALRWAQRRRLMDLLRHGCLAEGVVEGPNSSFSLAETDIEVLLRVSPRISRSAVPKLEPEGAPTSASIGATRQVELPTQDEVFASIVESIKKGAADEHMKLEPGVVAYLRDYYFDWIVKPGREGGGREIQTPQEIWESASGEMLRGFLEQVGRGAAQAAKKNGKQAVDKGEILDSAARVEASGMDPWFRAP